MSSPEHAPVISNSELFADFLTNEGMDAVFSAPGLDGQARLEEPLPVSNLTTTQSITAHVHIEPTNLSDAGISQDIECDCVLNPQGAPLQNGEYYTTLSLASSNNLLEQLSHDERRQQDLSEVIGVMSRAILPTDALISNLLVYESDGRRICPVENCGKSCNRPRHAIDHILAAHLKIKIRCLLWSVRRPI
jgi:hypothetical protein